MPTIDIDDTDLQLLEAIKKAGGLPVLDNWSRAHNLHNALLGNKSTRRDYEKNIKTIFPTAQTSSDIAEPYVEEFRDVAKKVDDFLAGQAAAAEERSKTSAQDAFNQNWAQAVKDHNLTPEGEDKLAEFMKKRNLHDPESAALSYFKHNPPPAEPLRPDAITPQGWGLGTPTAGETEEEAKFLVNDPDRWADMEAARTLNQIRAGEAV